MEMNENENVTLAVVVSELGHLRTAFDDERKERREDFDKFRTEMRQFHEDKVGRGEWLQRNAYVDSAHVDIRKEITAMKTQEAARRSPWTAVVGSITGVGALLVSGILAVVVLFGGN